MNHRFAFNFVISACSLLDQAAYICAQTLKALIYLHNGVCCLLPAAKCYLSLGKKIFHRDIKAGNLLITEVRLLNFLSHHKQNGDVKLTDFGISKEQGDSTMHGLCAVVLSLLLTCK